jgi:hypothetical protein
VLRVVLVGGRQVDLIAEDAQPLGRVHGTHHQTCLMTTTTM